MATITDPLRLRLIAWDDPAPSRAAAPELSGIELLRAMQRGELPAPPFASLTGMRLDEVGEGRAVFSLTPDELHENPMGTMHGGLVTALADSAMGCALQTLLPPGTGYTTVELKTNFVRPVTTAVGRVRAEGTVVHHGGRIATTEARVLDDDGTLYAHATSTCLVLRPRREVA